MKLLSPKQVNKQQTSLRDKQARKGAEISSLLKRGKQQLQKLKDNYDKNKALFDKDLLDFSKEISNKRRELEAELEVLEERKRIALEPIEKHKLMLDTKIEKLSELDTILDEKQEDIDEKEVELNIKEADLLELRQELDIREKDIDSLEERLDEKESKIQEDIIYFNRQKKDWSVEKNQGEIDINTLKKDYKLKLDATTKLEKSLKEQQVQLDKDKQHLYSQQSALRNAFDEAKKKGLKI